MAQEAVRRDELVDQFTTTRSVSLASTSTTGPFSWTCQVPIASRPISRIECDLTVYLDEVAAGYNDVKNGPAFPFHLFCSELSAVVGQVAGAGSSIEYPFPYSYTTVGPTDVESIQLAQLGSATCQPIHCTTWVREPKAIPVMTLTLMEDGPTSLVPFVPELPAVGGVIGWFVTARFTFFGPRDTRMYI